MTILQFLKQYREVLWQLTHQLITYQEWEKETKRLCFLLVDGCEQTSMFVSIQQTDAYKL